MHRRLFLKSMLSTAVAAPAILRSVGARAAEVTLRLHHFLPATSNGHTSFLSPWSKKVESESQGRIKIDIFPAMQLGGAPPQLFDQARDGVADIVWTLPGNTPGRFPKIEVFELPFMASRMALVNSMALQEFAVKQLEDEFKEIHPICFWAHDHGVIHTTRRAVKTMADLKGLKLRFPTRLAGEALKALGASPIGMPVPQVPEALAQKVIDGAVLPWEVVPSLKVHELVKFHTDIPGSPTLYTATFVLAMNKAKYEALPPDLQGVIDANSGTAAATMAGVMWDTAGEAGVQLATQRGNTLYSITEAEKEKWRKATQPVIDRWRKASTQKGFDGGVLLDEAQHLIEKYSTT